MRGNVTSDDYQPAKGLLVTKTQIENTNWKTVTTLSPAWAQPTKVVDKNGRVAETTYDPLGRTSGVWDPGVPRTATSTPQIKFTYTFDPDRKTYPYVVTESLNAGGGTDVSYQFYDGMRRPRQTQEGAVGGGRVVSDTIYDEYGNVSTSYAGHAEPGTASGRTRVTARRSCRRRARRRPPRSPTLWVARSSCGSTSPRPGSRAPTSRRPTRTTARTT